MHKRQHMRRRGAGPARNDSESMYASVETESALSASARGSVARARAAEHRASPLLNFLFNSAQESRCDSPICLPILIFRIARRFLLFPVLRCPGRPLSHWPICAFTDYDIWCCSCQLSKHDVSPL